MFPLLLFFLLLQMAQNEEETHSDVCTLMDTLQMLYEYHQGGDVFLGAIASQFDCLFDRVTFNEHPGIQFVGELL